MKFYLLIAKLSSPRKYVIIFLLILLTSLSSFNAVIMFTIDDFPSGCISKMFMHLAAADPNNF